MGYAIMRRTAGLICVLLACAAACSKSDTPAATTTGPTTPPPTPPVVTQPTPAASDTVNANPDISFSPQVITIKVGATVAYVFGSLGHNVIFNAVTGAPDDIVGVNSNTVISRTFNTAGTFPYQCTIHAGMTGSITVQ
jgi:plastocyanin